MKRSVSLTRRLIITLTAGAVVLWALASVASLAVLRVRLDDAFDGGLRETAERLLPLVAPREDHDGDEDGPAEEVPHFEERPGEYIVYQVRRGDGVMVLRSHDAPMEPFSTALTEGFAVSVPWRVYTLGTPDGGLWVQVAEDLGHRNASLLDAARALLWPIALFIPLSAFGIFVAVRAGLKPVRAFQREIEMQRATSLALVATDGLPVELQPVAGAVNGLIDRLRAAIEAERSFAANSAHELRTPLAASLAQVQRLVAELEGHAAEGRARQVEASLSRLRHLSEKLLQLSRADAGLWQAVDETDLLPAVRLLVADAARHAGEDRLVLDEGGLTTLPARIDIDAFGVALRNLIENALLHGAPGEAVRVRLAPGEVAVSNGGPVIAVERLRELTRRFVRGSSEREGSGLGLAIVDTIMAQCGGALVLSSPATGRADGFEARLLLPGR